MCLIENFQRKFELFSTISLGHSMALLLAPTEGWGGLRAVLRAFKICFVLILLLVLTNEFGEPGIFNFNIQNNKWILMFEVSK